MIQTQTIDGFLIVATPDHGEWQVTLHTLPKQDGTVEMLGVLIGIGAEEIRTLHKVSTWSLQYQDARSLVKQLYTDSFGTSAGHYNLCSEVVKKLRRLNEC